MNKKNCSGANLIDFDYKKGFANPLAALIATAVFVCLIIMTINIFSFSVYDDAVYLEEGWEVTHNEKTYTGIDLGKFVFSTVHRGDQITLRTTLPALPFDSTHMQIRIWHSTIEASVDGVSIFNYGKEDLAEGKPVGGGYQWIPLPRDIEGQTLEIKLFVTEYDSFTQFAPPMLHSSADMIQDFIRQNSPMCIVGLFLFAMGMISLLVAILFLLFQREALQLFWIALLSLDVGLWVLCRYGILQIISDNVQLNYYLEYLGLYLTAPLAFLCIYAIQEERNKQTLFTRIFIVTYLMYVPVLLLLHVAGILYVAEALRLCHIFIVVGSVFIFCYCFKRRNNVGERIKLLGVTALAGFSVMDLALFMWDELVPRGNEGIRYSMAAIGAVLFILILCINFGLTSVQSFYARMETVALKKMIYTDTLTSLFNRAKANEVMKSMDATPDIDCGILLFDLNRLKETNDRLGHAAGDTLICAFSVILRDSFTPLGTVARIGGDEFVVLFSTPNDEEVDRALEEMRHQIKEYNTMARSAPVSVAVGKACSWEVSDWNTEKLYRLADERMYACKKNMKSRGLV